MYTIYAIYTQISSGKRTSCTHNIFHLYNIIRIYSNLSNERFHVMKKFTKIDEIAELHYVLKLNYDNIIKSTRPILQIGQRTSLYIIVNHDKFVPIETNYWNSNH